MAMTDEAATAINTLKLANVRAKIQQQLEACGNDPVAAFHYKFLSENAEILSVEGGIGLNFNDHSEVLYQTELSCRTTILDFDKAEQIECKTGRHGIPPVENTRVTLPYSSAVVVTEVACYHPASEI